MKTLDTHRFSGAGGAHFGLFGRSLVLREPEDKGGGSGGGTGGDPAGEGSGEPATPPAGANDKPKTFTQEEVNRLTANARKEERERSQRRAQPAQPPSSDDGDKPLSMKELKAQLDEERSRRQFDRRAAKLGLSDEQTDDLFTLYQAQKPTDSDAWFETKSKLFAKGDASTNPNPNNPAPANPETPKPPAAPRAPSKVDPIAANGLLDIFSLTPEAIDQMGPMQLRAKLEEVVAFANARSGAPPLPRGPQQRK